MKILRILQVLFLSASVAGCRRQAPADQAPGPTITGNTIVFPAGSPQLSALTIETSDSRPNSGVQLSGRLVWNDDATVRVFTPFAGRVRKSLAQVGQVIESNAPLAEVDSPDFGQAQADARKARSDHLLAQRSLARLRELFDHGAAAQKDVESAEADATRAESEQARADSRLAMYGCGADSTSEIFTLRSPIAGTIVEKNINPGQEIRPDQMLANMPQFTAPLFVVSDPSRLWVQIDAAERDLARLKVDNQFTISSRVFPGQTFAGRVDVVSQFIDPNTRTVRVRGVVDDTRGLLKAEMFVSVDVPENQASSVGVPSKAVILKGEKHYVFIEEDTGKFARQEVKVGSEQNGRIFVLSGVQAGQRVVTDGSILLQEIMD